MLRIVTGGGTLSSTPVSSELCTDYACNRADKPSRGQDLSPRPFVGEGVRRTGEGSHPDKIAQQVRNDSVSSLAPRRESGFAYGRSVASPDSEQIEHVIAEQFMRSSVSVEQIQDRVRENKSSAVISQKRGGKAAFTLAEVLITLGIIGVVAAMTLPSLIQNYQKKALATQTQKFYSTMSQAVKQYMADYGVDDLRNTPLAGDNYDDDSKLPEAIASIRDFATKYLKVVKECNPSDENDNNCFAPVYRLWDNSIPDGENTWNFTTGAAWSYRRDYVLADGSVIRIGYWGPIELFVDVNGKKGPNRVGYDLWNMDIFYDGVIDESNVGPGCRGGDKSLCETPQEKRERQFEGCKAGTYGGCFGHLLNNNFKFDY